MLVHDQGKRRILHREFVKRDGLAQDDGIEVSAQYHEGVGLIGIDDEHTIQHGHAVAQFRKGGCTSSPGGQEARDIRRSPPYQ